MLRKNVVLLVGLAAAAGGPYLMTLRGDVPDNGLLPAVEAPLADIVAAPPMVQSPVVAPLAAAPQAAAPQAAESLAPLANQPLQHFGEAIRFDINEQWIVDHWPRITTTLSEVSLEGFRVIFVSGTKPDDITGTLTYYFDPFHRVQRIAFEGHTGDERRLVDFLQKNYAFQFYPSLGAGLYLATWNGAPTSVLQVQHVPVIDSTNRHMRLRVRLEINRPGPTYGLSPEFRKLLDQGRSAGRW